MVTVVALVLAMGLAVQETGQEHPKIPKDSIQVVVTGSLKGRVLAVSSVRQTDAQSGPDIRSRSFRLAGKKAVGHACSRGSRLGRFYGRPPASESPRPARAGQSLCGKKEAER